MRFTQAVVRRNKSPTGLLELDVACMSCGSWTTMRRQQATVDFPAKCDVTGPSPILLADLQDDKEFID